MNPTYNEKLAIRGLPGWYVDRRCQIFHEDALEPEPLDWPYATVDINSSGSAELALAISAPQAAALAFLPREVSVKIWDELCGAQVSKNSARVKELAHTHNVSEWVILECARQRISEFQLSRTLDLIASGDFSKAMQIHSITEAHFQSYPQPLLVEKYRSPSKGGNTRALHSHLIVIGDQKFTFRAIGAKKWAFKGDRVSFNYVITENGYHNVLKRTFRAIDKNRQEVVRGERGYKAVMRTATQKAPTAGRERHDN